jgi:type VI secretion system secreted protein VgrG
MTDPTRRIEATLSTGCLQGPRAVHAVRGVEGLSKPFRYEVDVAVGGADFDAVRGALAHVELTSDLGEVRHIDGSVESLSMVLSDEEAASSVTRVRLVIVPRASLTRLRKGFRIHQDQSVPDIVRRVFRDAGLNDALFRWTVGRAYAPREYCVQYDESEWDFVSRLLEEEGIYYWFEHAADGHVMVFADASDTGPAMEPRALTFTHDPDVHDRTVRAWEWLGRARAAEDSVSLVDYDLH